MFGSLRLNGSDEWDLRQAKSTAHYRALCSRFQQQQPGDVAMFSRRFADAIVMFPHAQFSPAHAKGEAARVASLLDCPVLLLSRGSGMTGLCWIVLAANGSIFSINSDWLDDFPEEL